MKNTSHTHKDREMDTKQRSEPHPLQEQQSQVHPVSISYDRYSPKSITWPSMMRMSDDLFMPPKEQQQIDVNGFQPPITQLQSCTQPTEPAPARAMLPKPQKKLRMPTISLRKSKKELQLSALRRLQHTLEDHFQMPRTTNCHSLQDVAKMIESVDTHLTQWHANQNVAALNHQVSRWWSTTHTFLVGLIGIYL